MWRIAHSFARGLRSARPSQCYSQDCSEDGSSKYNHQISEVQAATLKHYSVASCWSPLTVKNKCNSLGEIKCGLTQGSFSQVCERIHTRSWCKGTPRTERTVIARYQPKCPPWHWEILQDNSNFKEHCSENEEKEKKQRRNDWKKTCRFEEWKESLHVSPTLHALGWGSAAALTWSLLYDNSEHHSSHYKKKREHYLSQRGRKKFSHDLKVVKNESNENEEILIYHKPYEYFFTSESRNDENNKKHLTKVYEDQSKSNCRSTNLIKSYKCQTQEMVIPIYSLQDKFFDKIKKWSRTQASSSFTEKYKLEEIFKDDDNLEAPILLDKCFSEQEKADSGCMTDTNESLQSQTYSKKTDVHNEYSRSEENIDIKTVSDISSSWDPLETSEYLESTGEEHEPSLSREHHQPINNPSDNDVKVLCDKLLKIVKAHHEERLSHMDQKDDKTIFDTNPEEMVVYLQAGVLMGDITSTFNLALCYHMGHGVTQDLEKARKLYEVASAAGYGWATYNLAVILNQEFKVPSLHPKVHSLLLQAAQLGVKEAEDALSALLEEEHQQNVRHKDDDGIMRRCNSEPSLFSFLDMEYPYSYSTSDLQSLLDEGYSGIDDYSTVAKVSQKV